MNPEDFPAPRDGFVLTDFLVVSDQDRSRLFYQTLFDGQVLIERAPVHHEGGEPGRCTRNGKARARRSSPSRRTTDERSARTSATPTVTSSR